MIEMACIESTARLEGEADRAGTSREPPDGVQEVYAAVSKIESGNKLFVRILLPAWDYPREMVDKAIEKALRSGNVSYEYIVATLKRTSLPMGRAHDSTQALPGKLLEFRVRPANVSQFNMLIGEGREDV